MGCGSGHLTEGLFDFGAAGVVGKRGGRFRGLKNQIAGQTTKNDGLPGLPHGRIVAGAYLEQSPLHGALNERVFRGPAALGGLAEGFLGRLEELFGFGEADLVGGEAGDFRD
jgi:hypothetical protein